MAGVGVGVSVTTLAARGCTTALFPLVPCAVLDRRPGGTTEPPVDDGLPVAPDIAANTQSDEAIVGDMAKCSC
jgi:hypothetical protein